MDARVEIALRYCGYSAQCFLEKGHTADQTRTACFAESNLPILALRIQQLAENQVACRFVPVEHRRAYLHQPGMAAVGIALSPSPRLPHPLQIAVLTAPASIRCAADQGTEGAMLLRVFHNQTEVAVEYADTLSGEHVEVHQ